ncbi:MAG: flagellar hook capping FlgD N-terminal domain-containing protein [Planctomycetota bacterium]
MDPISETIAAGSGRSIFSAQGADFGDNPFLEVLVTQLQSQTPLEPVDNSAFMDQMAQLSSMEEQRELNDNLLELLNFQGVLAKLQGLSEGSNLLGKEVSFVNSQGEAQSGLVQSVFVNEVGEVRVVVSDEEGKTEIGFDQVVAVSEPDPDASSTSEGETTEEETLS